MKPKLLLSMGVLLLAPTFLAVTRPLDAAPRDLSADRAARAGIPGAIDDLGFLEGAWFGTDGRGEWESVYTGPLGGEVLSASKEVRGDKVVTHDFERFFVQDGSLVMTPFPRGKKSHDFPLVELDPDQRRAVFENADNDFPRRFTYHRIGDERLTIRLEGSSGGNPIEIEIEFERQ